ncbi:hypothetical protein B0H63DRAFT_236424 [Podospora didyma]|uniref:LIM zinc-binding domain-containing protein n=1 Tax=Podospora didyma TaxID=330526 RepID=A0AAE0KJT6_9PEZI|nr:hypothetical protein B0H63DRAFT_236424 [Podospora didyma]
MTGAVRESSFMPTVKCSNCGKQVEISMMGEHDCSGAPTAEPTPPIPAPSLFERFLPFGAASTDKQMRMLPEVDTSAANRVYMGQGQLTPVSLSSGSRSVSPKTPNGRPGSERADEYFSPRIANDSPPPQQSRRPGGYGGFGDGNGYEDPAYPANNAKKQAPSLMDRMNTIAPGPFESGRRPPTTGRTASAGDISNDRPSTSASNMSSSLGSIGNAKVPRAPRKNGYGGFGPPRRAEGDVEPQPLSLPNRSETFPRPSEVLEPPMRTPSAPGPRPDRLRPTSPEDMDPRTIMTSERTRRPSRGPDTSRPPPPRSAGIPELVRPKTPGVPAINLAEEFGIGNPYHASSESSSSTASDFSQSERRPSQASSRTSPPRSLASRSGGRKPSDTSLDNLMTDLQSSIEEQKPKAVVSPLSPSPGDLRGRPSPFASRPPRTGGYDPRIDPAMQNGRARRPMSPLASPALVSPVLDLPDVDRFPTEVVVDRQFDNEPLPVLVSPPSPLVTRSPERIRDPSPPQIKEPVRSRSRSRAREPVVQSSRGDCKDCGEPIFGKSVASADGRLTGRYHKACFVCFTCRQPFSSSTFYVLDDKPYCHKDYHELNNSLCGSCNKGIEGQYLEDETTKKHHVGCFKCGDCGMALKDGYFEVNKNSYCEKDAWRRVQQPWIANGGPPPPRKGPTLGPGPRPMNLGLPGGPRAVGFGARSPLGPRPRMEKRMTRLGMM